jgi:hypothetical protein
LYIQTTGPREKLNAISYKKIEIITIYLVASNPSSNKNENKANIAKKIAHNASPINKNVLLPAFELNYP